MDIDWIVRAVAEKIFVEVEASGRHVHVTKQQALALFGHPLTPKRPLSQPGQYLANERVTVIGPKGAIKASVLGPTRPANQVELSFTDARTVGLVAPIRESGDVAGTPGCTLEGPCGKIEISEGVMVAKRHIHFDTATANEMGIADKQIVKVKIDSERTTIFDDVVIRVSEKFAPAMHIDTDESNAACAFGAVYGEIVG